MPWTRATVTTPILERLTERLDRVRAELGSSSRNRTPLWASEISPGRTGEPPPSKAGRSTIVWCGARNGRSSTSRVGAARRHEWSFVVSSASSARHRGEHGREPPREHRLAGTGRAREQHVVPAGDRDLERSPREVLAADVGQVDRCGARRLHLGTRSDLRRLPRAAKEACHLAQRGCSDDAQPVHDGGLTGARARRDDSLETARRSRHGHRERPGCRDETPVERQLTEHRESRELLGRHLRGGREDTGRERQVQTRTVLPKVAGREVHHDPPRRPRQTGVLDSGTDPISRVLDGRAGKTRERQGGQSPPDVDLDGHEVTAHPDDRHSEDAPVHGSEGVLEQLDVGDPVGAHEDAGDIEPDRGGFEPSVPDEDSGKAAKTAPLGSCDGLIASTERGSGTRLDLADDHDSRAPNDEVELTQCTAPVARDQPVPGADVHVERGVLTAATEPSPAIGDDIHEAGSLRRATDIPAS